MPDLAPLDGVDRYVPSAVLGRGGMSVVYAAWDRQLGRSVALKVAHPDPHSQQRLLREGAILAEAAVQGMPALLDRGQTASGGGWIALAQIDGASLAALLAARDRPALLPILARLAEALAAAHARGVVHRDLKPANVLVDPAGCPWLLDWGLARILPDSPLRAAVDPALDAPTPAGSGDSSDQGAVMGTPAYMSPEQITGAPVGTASDVWSLGVVLWELVYGRRAYPGERRAAIFGQILAAPPPLDAVPPDTPPALRDLIRRCVSLDPARRPATAEVARTLRAASAEPPRRPRRAGLGAVLVLAVAGLAGLLAWSRGALAPVSAPEDPHLTLEAAWSAHRSGDPARAEQLALRSLEAGGPAWARGLLLRHLPRPTLTLDQDGLRCGIGEDLSRDGQIIICAQPGHTVAWKVGERAVEELWRQDLEVHLIKFLGGTRLLLQSGGGEGAFVVDIETGAPVSLPITALRSSGRLSDSRVADRFFGRGPEGWVRVRLDGGGATTEPVVEPLPAPPCRGLLTVDPGGRELVACSDEVVAFEGGRWRTVVSRPDGLSPFTRWMWNGPLLVASSEDYSLSVFDPADDSLTPQIDQTTQVAGGGPWMASQSHGHRIYIGRLGQARGLWQAISRHSAHRRITDDGELVTVARARVMRWALPEQAEVQAWHAEGPVRALVWADELLAAQRADGQIRIWRGEDEVFRAEGVRALAARGDTLAMAAGDRLLRWDPGAGARPLAEETCMAIAWLGEDVLCGPLGPGPLVIDGESGAVDRRAALPDSTWFAAAGAETGEAVVMEWSTQAYRMTPDAPDVLTPLLHDPEARAMSLSPDGRHLAVSQRFQIALYAVGADGIEGAPRLLARGDHMGTPHAWSHDSRRLAVADLDGVVHIWDVAGGDELARIPPGEEGQLALAFSPDGQRLARALPSGLIVVHDLAPLAQPVAALRQDVEATWGREQ